MTKHITERKKKYIKLIHIAKNQLCLDDDTYRDILYQETDKTSTKDMTIKQLITVLDRLKLNGFRIHNPTTHPAETKQNRLILHLWNTLYQSNIVKNQSEQALLKFIQRRFKHIDNLQSLTNEQASYTIEHLKKWCERENIQYH